MEARETDVSGTLGLTADQAALAGTVTRLTDENVHLRRAMRHRAVLEQAKGALAVEMGVDPETAFAALRQLSMERNLKLHDVAATVLARLTAEGGRRSRVHAPAPGTEDATTVGDRASTLLARADLDASSDLDGLAAAAVRAARWPVAADRSVLLQLLSDGSLEIVGSCGLPDDVRSSWRRIPPNVDFPACLAVQTGEPVWCDDPVRARERFSSLRETTVLRTVADLPLAVDGHLLGVLGLGWPTTVPFGDDDKRHLLALADDVADRLVRALHPVPFVHPVISSISALVDGPALALHREVSSPGATACYRVAWVNRATADLARAEPHELVDRDVLELLPGLVDDAVAKVLDGVATTGHAAVVDIRAPHAAEPARLSLVRIFGDVVLTGDLAALRGDDAVRRPRRR